MLKIFPELAIDWYKNAHRPAYPKGTQNTVSTWTARATKIKGINEVVVAGNQMFCQGVLIELWDEMFFKQPKHEVVARFERYVKNCLFDNKPFSEHIAALHDVGYLPIEIKALPEGTVVPIRTPMLTIEATMDEFYWLPTYLETQLSSELWPVYTAATISHNSRKTLEYWQVKTGGPPDFVSWQSHDFSMRGMMGLYAGALTGLGHLLSFFGTDTVTAIMASEQFYKADMEKGIIGGSVNALEHSTQMTCIEVRLSEMLDNKDPVDAEIDVILQQITEIYKTGIISIVMDTNDYFRVIRALGRPAVKAAIMAREGKLVCRPDSGDPFLILTGNPDASGDEKLGTMNILWEIFGGTENSLKFKELDSHIGAIYGDSITLSLQEKISQKLFDMQYASTNVVYGLGSFTFQYNTRDTFGHAMKTVWTLRNGVQFKVAKNPKTDDGTKRSQRGCVAVFRKPDDTIGWLDGLSYEQAQNYPGNLLTTIFKNGKMVVYEELNVIRERLALHTKKRVLERLAG